MKVYLVVFVAPEGITIDHKTKVFASLAKAKAYQFVEQSRYDLAYGGDCYFEIETVNYDN